MTSGQTKKLTKRVIDAAHPKAKRYAVNDTEIPGFKIYIHPSGRKSFHLRYRVGGGRSGTIREPKIGDMGRLTPDQARAIARDWQAEVQRGADPSAAREAVRKAPLMRELLDNYIERHAKKKNKPSSVANSQRIINSKILPVLGRKKVEEVSRGDVAALHDRLFDTPYEANRVLALLSKAFNLAEVWGWRSDGSNPCRHVQKFEEQKRKRFLSTAELERLGASLRAAERGEIGPVPASAILAIRLLVLTGARKSEVLGLQWEWIDFETGRAFLPDSKTGEKILHLPAAALSVLQAAPRRTDNPHVIVGGKPGAALVNLKDPWGVIRKHAGLEDVRVHDLRHSFASVAVAGGATLPVIGALLGHTQTATTQRYAHLADDPLRAAVAKVGNEIEAAMSGRSANVVSISGGR